MGGVSDQATWVDGRSRPRTPRYNCGIGRAKIAGLPQDDFLQGSTSMPLSSLRDENLCIIRANRRRL